MKKILFISLLCFITSNFLYAQKGYGGGVNFAYHSVWILNQSAYGDLEHNEIKTYHPAFGLHGFYNPYDAFGVWMELNFITLGQKYEGAKSQTRDIELKYIAIPIMAKYTGKGDMVRFHFMLGPELAFLTKATQDYNMGTSGNAVSRKDLDGKTFVKTATDIKDRFVKMDFMLAFDIGADISINEFLLVNAGLRANYGFRDINAKAYRIPNFDNVYTASHNMYFGFQVGVSYLFGMK